MTRRKAKNKHYGVSKPLLQRIRGMRPAVRGFYRL